MSYLAKIGLRKGSIGKGLKRQDKAFAQKVIAAERTRAAAGTQARPNVLITMPWMTFGGAETLVYNYCNAIKDNFNIHFITGLKSENEWEYKFREISDSIYHLPSLIDDPSQYIDFVSGYIHEARIDVLHLVHNGFMFDMLPVLKERHPSLKVILTLFNDRVPEYVAGAVKYQPYIDRYVSDNAAVARSLKAKIKAKVDVTVIPNGVDAYTTFSPELFDRDAERAALGVEKDQLAVFFVGRLSPEKNPNVFIEAARQASKQAGSKLKFFVVGDGNMRDEIQKLIAESNGVDITWLGYQSAVAKYLSAADVFVLPSSIEGFPLSILEAMAMQVTVIASDVGAVAEVVKSGSDGFVVKPGSAKEIAEKLRMLDTNRSMLQKMKANVRTSVEQKYSNRVLGANYTKLYKDMAR